MKNILILGLLGVMTACACDEDPQPELSDDYLPLAIGNYWEFKGTGFVSNELVEHREVVDRVNLNNMEYYVLESTHLATSWSGAYKDSAYYRIDNDGYVYVYRKSLGFEENRYRLNGKDGDTWSYDFIDQYIADMTLREVTRNIGKVYFDNCKDYSFDVEQWADEE